MLLQHVDYTGMIDLENDTITSPPILNSIHITDEKIDELAAVKISEMDLDIDLNALPCHTQSVERCIKAVTESSTVVTSETKRLGWILNTLKSRNIMPSISSKKDFRVNINDKSRCTV